MVPFTIPRGKCFFCDKTQFSACANSNPVEKQDLTAALHGHPMRGLFGCSRLTGGQAEYVRVPHSDVARSSFQTASTTTGCCSCRTSCRPERWRGGERENRGGRQGRPMGMRGGRLFSIQSALALGAHKVTAIDHCRSRPDLARRLGAEALDYQADPGTEEGVDELMWAVGTREVDALPANAVIGNGPAWKT